MTNPPYALILAGGSGERFWPLSRRARPKQLLKLVSDKTLLEETLDRLAGLVPDERILVLTNVDQEAAVRELLPNLPPENIVAEPAKRDTAAAVALATAWVAARDHRATMMVLPADHVINDRDAFQKTMQMHHSLLRCVSVAALVLQPVRTAAPCCLWVRRFLTSHCCHRETPNAAAAW